MQLFCCYDKNSFTLLYSIYFICAVSKDFVNWPNKHLKIHIAVELAQNALSGQSSKSFVRETSGVFTRL